MITNKEQLEVSYQQLEMLSLALKYHLSESSTVPAKIEMAARNQIQELINELKEDIDKFNKKDDMWEYYLDNTYYDLWAVRPVDDKNFNSGLLFHVSSENEAEKLTELLNTRMCQCNPFENP